MLAASLMVTLSACETSNLPGPSGTVQGLATYQGKPIPTGSAIVLVHDQQGLVGSGVTDAAGSFEISMNGSRQVLVGDYTVYVRPPGEPGENVLVYNSKTVPPEWNKIPQSYWSASTTKARFTVQEGTNEFDFKLVD